MASPLETAGGFLGIPYRGDGALDQTGRYTTFADPLRSFETPGLNCSGLVLALGRPLLGRPFTLAEASRDRQDNSGPGAPLGEDWDFGLDLLLNLTEGLQRRVMLPGGSALDYPLEDGLAAIGFDIHDPLAWPAVRAELRPGHLYLGSLSRPARLPGYLRLHHHVVALLPGPGGEAWLYHATGRQGVHRLDLSREDDLARFQGQFPQRPEGTEHLLLIEVPLPESEAP